MNLWQDFLINQSKPVRKWAHYFPIYERHFAKFRNQFVTILEIGVWQGGSLEMWQRYLGPNATIVGIDIDPNAKQHESQNIHVRIGDQSDVNFLDQIILEFGVPDILLDDGSHVMSHINATFDHLYPKMQKNSVYMVEDLHTAYWQEFGGELLGKNTFIEKTKSLIDHINAFHTRGSLEPNQFSKDTASIHIYDSIVCFEKGTVTWRSAPITGQKSL
jgi:23S rRNA U2552 (ribose-2'-O)-methylase RlmE/FtsJ